MKIRKSILLFSLSLLLLSKVWASTQADSLVPYQNLVFHSELEAQFFQNFAQHNRDTFGLFMAIDPETTEQDVAKAEKEYTEIMEELILSDIQSKKINKQVKKAYVAYHDRFLKKYNGLQFFPAMFRDGTYNCASASMLYALALDRLDIPYKVMVSSEHVYLVASPGEHSIVIETTNPRMEDAIFNGDFKAQYVNYLRQSKLISETDYKSKSTEEIFEEQYNRVREEQFINLPGIQYYNKGLEKLKENKVKEAFELLKKAWYFFPDDRVKVLLYNATVALLDQSDFKELPEIDYLLQFSRFDEVENDLIVGVFSNIIHGFTQYTDKEDYLNLLHERLVSGITDPELKDEISFNFYLQMSYSYREGKRTLDYIANAVKIKDNHRDTNLMFEHHIRNKLGEMNDYNLMLDSISALEVKYDFEFMKPIYAEYRSRAWLRVAENAIDEQKPKACEQYMALFEEHTPAPLENQNLIWTAERVYRKLAVYYFYRYKSMAKKTVARGLQYVPGSKTIQSAVY